MSRREGADPRVEAWWDAVLAGDTDEPHPLYGSDISARIRGDCLTLAGELARPEDRAALIRQAHARIGSGFRDVDASRLRVPQRPERRGLLEQTLIAAYPNASIARRASKFVLEHGRVTPKAMAIVEHGGKGVPLAVPPEYAEDVTKRLSHGEALLVVRVDETEAFRVRELMDEETRSTWTVAAAPQLASSRGR
jgi:hypothetical protein